MTLAASSARLKSSMEAIGVVLLPEGTTMPTPTLQICTWLFASIRLSFARFAMDRVEPTIRSAVSPCKTLSLMAPIVAYSMINLCPEVRSYSLATCLKTDCIAAADRSRISAAAAGELLPDSPVRQMLKAGRLALAQARIFFMSMILVLACRGDLEAHRNWKISAPDSSS